MTNAVTLAWFAYARAVAAGDPATIAQARAVWLARKGMHAIPGGKS